MANPQYSDLYNAAYGNAAILDQTLIACVQLVRTIFTELTSVTDHANRVLWAVRFLNNPKQSATNLLLGVITDATVQTTLPTPGPTDAQVLAAVSTIVNVFADNGL